MGCKMKKPNLLLWRQSQMYMPMAALAVSMAMPNVADAQIPYKTQAGNMVIYKSTAASRVVEQVRSEAQRLMVEIFAKAGDVQQIEYRRSASSVRPQN